MSNKAIALFLSAVLMGNLSATTWQVEKTGDDAAAAADAGSPLYKAQVRLEKVTVTAGGRPSVYVEKDSRIVAVGCSFDGEIRKAKGGVFEEEGR